VTCHTRIIDPNIRRDFRDRDEHHPELLNHRPPSRRRPLRWAKVAKTVTSLAAAALAFYLLTSVIATQIDSWLIGLVGACLVALVLTAMLAPGSSSPAVRRS
jgi:peptidoglycan/LPS O-acetylase OafA/YrhL